VYLSAASAIFRNFLPPARLPTGFPGRACTSPLQSMSPARFFFFFRTGSFACELCRGRSSGLPEDGDLQRPPASWASLSLKSVAFDASNRENLLVSVHLGEGQPVSKQPCHILRKPAAGAFFPFLSVREPICASKYTAAVKLASSNAVGRRPARILRRLRFASCLQLNKISRQCIEVGNARSEECGNYREKNADRPEKVGINRPDSAASYISGKMPIFAAGHAVALGVLHQVTWLRRQGCRQSFLGPRIRGIGRHAHAGP